MTEPALRIEHLTVRYPLGGRRFAHAVTDVSLTVAPGEIVGLVGESGCGKSSVARSVMALRRPDAGRVLIGGVDVTALRGAALRRARRDFQMVFQDPRSSLNPHRTVRQILTEGLAIQRVPRPWDDQVDDVLRAVGLDPATYADRRPRQLSGGQCQRVAIARAVLLRPRLLVCDEPVSALDTTVSAQVLDLLRDVRDRYGVAILFIAHDLAVVRGLCDRVAVMYLGRICETGAVDEVLARPRHPYTRALLDAVPRLDGAVPAGEALRGDPASNVDPPSGCRFHPRCAYASPRCAAEEPVLAGEDEAVACHHPLAPVKAG
ncbi:oligopeptide/dipeptide ABC transporter ATP-binding protein [Pseudonocardia thermophila]|jgi:oligopeptide/dipeptide ABC transporter, ATP-binding protein, C-terminal domain|uniref:oligopeptide/dipeptide ABC transporter ATP-binding protein n=1 Tax=Pseudonocardia thermophila TaxID=1848 RepID=UPI00248F2C0C|nr:ABC transporter ATP-binding protein [Pseudonocardia thermophila]